jgi:hypothetical protein
MQFTINGMTIPLAVPYLKAEAALELITAEDDIQLNVLDRHGMAGKTINIDLTENGTLLLRVRDRILEPASENNTIVLLHADDTLEDVDALTA